MSRTGDALYSLAWLLQAQAKRWRRRREEEERGERRRRDGEEGIWREDRRSRKGEIKLNCKTFC